MKKILYILLLCCGQLQANVIDSLYLDVRGDVMGRLENVNKLMIQLDAQGCSDSLYTFTKQDRKERIEATLALYMAYYYYDHGMYVLSEELSQKAMQEFGQLGQNEQKSDAIAHLSTTLLREGKLEEAIRNTIEGLHIDSLLHDPERLSSSYNNLAAFYLAAGHTQESEQYILKAIKIEESLKEPRKLAIRYGVASEVYTNLKDYARALSYISKAYDLDKKDGNTVGAARRQSQMGDIYLAMKEYQEAERLYKNAVETLLKEGEAMSTVITYKQLGKLYAEMGEWDKCLEVLQKNDQQLRQMGAKHQLMQNVKVMAEAYRQKGMYREADRCSKEALELTQEIQSNELQQLTTEFTSRYNMMKMEQDMKNSQYWTMPKLIGGGYYRSALLSSLLVCLNQ